MKKAVWISFVALLLFSLTAVYGQTDQSAVKSNEEETAIEKPTMKPQKVSEVRQVVRVVKAQKLQSKNAEKGVQYDAKGGIIVPNKSEGIKQTHLTPAQKRKLEHIKNAQSKNSLRSSRNQVQKDFRAAEKRRTQQKQSKKSATKKSQQNAKDRRNN